MVDKVSSRSTCWLFISPPPPTRSCSCTPWRSSCVSPCVVLVPTGAVVRQSVQSPARPYGSWQASWCQTPRDHALPRTNFRQLVWTHICAQCMPIPNGLGRCVGRSADPTLLLPLDSMHIGSLRLMYTSYPNPAYLSNMAPCQCIKLSNYFQLFTSLKAPSGDHNIFMHIMYYISQRESYTHVSAYLACTWPADVWPKSEPNKPQT